MMLQCLIVQVHHEEEKGGKNIEVYSVNMYPYILCVQNYQHTHANPHMNKISVL